jgi:hypothetical protein
VDEEAEEIPPGGRRRRPRWLAPVEAEAKALPAGSLVVVARGTRHRDLDLVGQWAPVGSWNYLEKIRPPKK